MKVLLLRFSSIGDIVLTTPVIRTVKTQVDNAEVHFATKVGYKAILESNPYIDKVHCLEDDLRKLVSELRKEKFDFIIDLHNNLRTRIIKLALGVKSSSFDKLNYEKWLMVNFKINKLPHVHIVERYLAAAAPLGVKNDSLGLDYFIPDKDQVPVDWLPEEMRSGYVVYAIGGQHFTKKLPVERMIELCDKINRPIILLGGKEDLGNGDIVRERVTRSFIYNACGKFNLNQSASIVKQANYVFSHDTGLMHIAAAFRKEIFSIWGNTIPLFGMYPYRTRFSVLENSKLDCRPCSKIGYDKCPKGHFRCMYDTEFDFYLP